MAFGADPFKRRARDLDKEEQALADHLASLREELDRLKNPPKPEPKPPVWKPELRPSDARRIERESVRRAERVHGAQRRRDRIRFFVSAGLLLLLLLWLVKRM
ncbi:MAG: hypothetical protein PW734_03340 [Verrucomicrobium sp.]|nr:hypothetical protein [Verrucomicrobium sp.]